MGDIQIIILYLIPNQNESLIPSRCIEIDNVKRICSADVNHLLTVFPVAIIYCD